MKRLISILIFFLFSITLSADSSRWVRIGPSAGTISKIVRHPKLPNVVFAINNEHLYKSFDFGKHWQLKPLERVQDVKIHFKTGVIYVVASIPNPGDYYNDTAIWVSNDGGDRFSILSIQDFELRNIAIHPDNSQVQYGWYYDLYSSKDGGLHWDLVTNRFPNDEYDEIGYGVQDVLFSPNNPKEIYVSAGAYVDHGIDEDRILRSGDVGKTWHVIFSRDNYRGPSGAFSFLQDPAFPGRVLAYSRGRGILQLTPKGWVFVSEFGIQALSSDPQHRSRLLGLHQIDYCKFELYQSLDEGVTWNAVDQDLNHRLTSVVLLGNLSGSWLGATNDEGIFRRDGNLGWKHSNAGMKEAFIFEIATDNHSQKLIAISSASNYSCSQETVVFDKQKAGNGWSNINSKLPYKEISIVSIDPLDSQHIFASSGSRAPQVTFDGGKTWAPTTFDENAYGAWVVFNQVNSNIVYATSSYVVYKSLDAGRTFHRLPLDFSGRGGALVLIDQTDPNILYFVSGDKSLYKSVDGGSTIKNISTTVPHYRFLIQLPQKNSLLLLGSGGRVFRSTDDGKTWKQISQIIKNNLRFSSGILYSADTKGEHFFATMGGRYFFESLDGGKNWTDLSGDFGKDVKIFQMTDPRNPKFYIATSIGVFQNQN